MVEKVDYSVVRAIIRQAQLTWNSTRHQQVQPANIRINIFTLIYELVFFFFILFSIKRLEFIGGVPQNYTSS